MTYGIHHITAISSDAQHTYDFYTGILGLRLVKRTVNQDDTQTYHLFFGDQNGTPGMDLTFFPFKGVREGIHGAGMVNQIMLGVKPGSIDYWKNRLEEFGIEFNNSENILGDKFLEFTDWDGQMLQIVETNRINPKSVPHSKTEVKEEYAIHNFYGAQINSSKKDIIEPLLEVILGFKPIKTSVDITVFENTNESYSNLIFSEIDPFKRSVNSNGTVHHIAFRVKTDEEQLELRDKISSFGLNPTEVIDRFYFKSVYFREPGGILFEIATDDPGFDVDEDIATLGEKLSLPPFIEDERETIEKSLEVLNIDANPKDTSNLRNLFHFIDIGKTKKNVLFLFHGTGGDEYDLLSLFSKDDLANYRIVSMRGNIKENGMNRFFKRFEMGKYDQESIKEESDKLIEFLNLFYKINKIDPKNASFVGFSNGANMILATMNRSNDLINKTALLHPAYVIDSDKIKLQKGVSALVTYGKLDRMIPIVESRKVVEKLVESGAKVEEFDNNYEHTITTSELRKIKEFLDLN